MPTVHNLSIESYVQRIVLEIIAWLYLMYFRCVYDPIYIWLFTFTDFCDYFFSHFYEIAGEDGRTFLPILLFIIVMDNTW